MKILIQPARPQHAEVLTEIAVAAKSHWGYPERWMQFWLSMLTISADYIAEHETWIAIVDDLPVAWYSLKATEEGLWLDNLWVLPRIIGKGVGRRLFQHALERSKLRDASLLKIEADPNAEAFYLHMGARKTGEHRGEVDGMPRNLPVLEIQL